MWGKLGEWGLALVASIAATSAPGHEQPSRCHVVDADKLPPEAGDARALCAAVEAAIAKRAPNISYSAEVRVLSRSALAATLVANGTRLPERRFAVTDRDLNPGSIERFAQSVAAAVAGAGRP
jgi:hypothetical protein